MTTVSGEGEPGSAGFMSCCRQRGIQRAAEYIARTSMMPVTRETIYIDIPGIVWCMSAEDGRSHLMYVLRKAPAG